MTDPIRRRSGGDGGLNSQVREVAFYSPILAHAHSQSVLGRKQRWPWRARD